MKTIIFIAIGGSIGAPLRYLISKNINSISGGVFPYGTLSVNILGSLVIGFLFALFNNVVIDEQYKALLSIGFLGAFTTFSSYSLETVNLFFDGEYKYAILNLVYNNVLAVAGAFLGILLFRYMHQFVK